MRSIERAPRPPVPLASLPQNARISVFRLDRRHAREVVLEPAFDC